MKSQAAVEFLIVLGFVLFFFVLFFIALNQNMSEKYREEEEIVVKNLALSIQDEINLASGATDGYSRQFKIDETLYGRTYYINIIDERIYIRTEKAAISLPVSNLTGNIKIGINVIKKENGRVYLN